MVGYVYVVAEAGEYVALDRRRARERGARLADGDLRRGVDRVAVDAAADGREGDRRHAVLRGEAEALAVARRQELRLPLVAAAPDRADGVDHVLRRQAVAARDARLAGRAAAEL